MPHDSEPKPEKAAELAAAAQHVLEAAKDDPIPPKIVELAQELQAAIAHQRKGPDPAR